MIITYSDIFTNNLIDVYEISFLIYCSLTFCVSNIWYVCLWMPVCSTSKISTNKTKIKRLSRKQFFMCWNAVAQKLLYFDAFPFNTYLPRQQKFGWENILFMNVHLNLSSFSLVASKAILKHFRLQSTKCSAFYLSWLIYD